MSDEAYTINTKGLDQLVKALKAKPPTTRVGILGDKAARGKKEGSHAKQNPSNAEIGAAHEFGAPARGIPERSFLRIPISERLEKEMESAGALSKNEMAEVLKQGSVIPWMRKIAVLAEGIVTGAFDSGGYGKWKAWKSKSYENNTGQILVDTTQLRGSITSEVKE